MFFAGKTLYQRDYDHLVANGLLVFWVLRDVFPDHIGELTFVDARRYAAPIPFEIAALGDLGHRYDISGAFTGRKLLHRAASIRQIRA